MPLRAISLGGGRQSTAMIVLWAQGKIEADVAIFADVGQQSDTIAYVADVIAPWMAERGLPLSIARDPLLPDIYSAVMSKGGANAGIPARSVAADGAPGRRSCTADFKIKPILKEIKRIGAGFAEIGLDEFNVSKDSPAIQHIGFSVDEVTRCKPSRSPFATNSFPLVEMGLTTEDCKRIVTNAGLPEPPRSACWFCPFHRMTEWSRLRREHPDLFAKAAALEGLLSNYSAARGKGELRFLRNLKPLHEGVADFDAQGDLFGFEEEPHDERCTDGAGCFT